MMCRKALWVFDFLRHDCSAFKNPDSFEIFNFILVRSILEYGLVIWNPYQTDMIYKIDHIQNIFSRVGTCIYNKQNWHI